MTKWFGRRENDSLKSKIMATWVNEISLLGHYTGEIYERRG